jgi:hypothetical protein
VLALIQTQTSKLNISLIYWTWLLLNRRENATIFKTVLTWSVDCWWTLWSLLLCPNWAKSSVKLRKHCIRWINFYTSRPLHIKSIQVYCFSNLFGLSFFNRMKIWNQFWHFTNTPFSLSCLLSVCQIHLSVLMANFVVSAFDLIFKFSRNTILFLCLYRGGQGSKVIHSLILFYYCLRFILFLKHSLFIFFFILGFESKRR